MTIHHTTTILGVPATLRIVTIFKNDRLEKPYVHHIVQCELKTTLKARLCGLRNFPVRDEVRLQAKIILTNPIAMHHVLHEFLSQAREILKNDPKFQTAL